MEDKKLIIIVLEERTQKIRIDKVDKISWYEVLGLLDTMTRVVRQKLHSQPPIMMDKLPGRFN